MFCPRCGAARTPGGRFCGNCGTLHPFASLTAATVGGPTAPPPTPDAGAKRPARSRRNPHSLTLVVVACMLALGLFFTVASSVVRTLTGATESQRTLTRDAAPSAARGAMGALLAPARHDGRADAPGVR